MFVSRERTGPGPWPRGGRISGDSGPVTDGLVASKKRLKKSKKPPKLEQKINTHNSEDEKKCMLWDVYIHTTAVAKHTRNDCSRFIKRKRNELRTRCVRTNRMLFSLCFGLGSVRRYTSEDIATFEDALRGAHDKAQAALNETRASTRLEVCAFTCIETLFNYSLFFFVTTG